MKVRFNRWYNAVLTTLLSMLGYGCSTGEPVEYGALEEYGVPYADYIFKGIVTDEAGTPVKGIKTSLKSVFQNEDEHYVLGLDSVETDVAGNYQLKYVGLKDRSLKVIVEDIDGEANGGEFLSDTLDIDYKKAVKTKDGSHWYEGAYEITQDVKLKKK
jgi:putative lipoprotein (rSAM/lipoprotein system)